MLDKKIKIKSISKSPLVSEYIFDKKQEVIEVFYEFFKDLGIIEDNFDLEHFLVTEEWDVDKTGKRFEDISNFEDFRYNILNDKGDNYYDIDVYVGVEKIFLVIRTRVDRQQEIAEKLFEYVEVEDGD